jgi:hypothetical protein
MNRRRRVAGSSIALLLCARSVDAMGERPAHAQSAPVVARTGATAPGTSRPPAPPALPRSSPNLLPSSWSKPQTVSRPVVTPRVKVTPGKTYTVSGLMRTSSWPTYVTTMIGTYDDRGRFLGNLNSVYQGTTAPNVWEEIAVQCTVKPGVAAITWYVGRLGKSPDESGTVQVSDLYVGEGVSFARPPTPKVPFNMSSGAANAVRVDELGNWEVRKNGGNWTAFFPLCIYAGPEPASRWQKYASQGFNCNIWNHFSVSGMAAEKAAGIMTMLEVTHYVQKDLGLNQLARELDAVLNASAADNILGYYWDNEQYDQYDRPQALVAKIRERDPNHPIMMNQGATGIHRSLRNLADLFGNYLVDYGTQLAMWNIPMPHMRNSVFPQGMLTEARFSLMQNLEGNSRPPGIANIAEEHYAPNVRRIVYKALINGVRALSYYRDGACYNYDGDPNGPGCTDLTQRPAWAEIKRLKAEIDQLMPLIRRPHWTNWSATSGLNPVTELTIGTRDHGGHGYLLLVNDTSAPLTATIKLSGLSYTPTSVQDFFTGARIAKVAASSFTAALAANETAVYRLAP